ncbi:hypothetical protein QE152_g15239 [Popillia japonica]|uniref:Uncharacterized protein n=1 Tax=Popillia japonica TaxID=7064 RepID=A0AAW1L6D3_POPJA
MTLVTLKRKSDSSGRESICHGQKQIGLTSKSDSSGRESICHGQKQIGLTSYDLMTIVLRFLAHVGLCIAIEYIFAFVKVITSKMAFTAEHDAFILMAHYRSATQDAEGNWRYSFPSCLKNCLNKQQNGHHFQHLL